MDDFCREPDEDCRKWTAWEEMVSAFPLYAINSNRLGFIPSVWAKEPERDPCAGNRRISGFHPRSPLTKKEAAAMLEDGLDLN